MENNQQNHQQNNQIQMLEVGQAFPISTKLPPADNCRMEMTQSGGLILLNYSNITDTEIQNITKGQPCKFGVYSKHIKEDNYTMIFLLVKYGTEQWIDLPYSHHLTQFADPTFILNKPSSTMGYGITSVVVESTTQIIKGIRLTTLPNKLSCTFYNLCLEQMTQTYNKLLYSRNLQEIYNQYSTKDMVNYGMIENVK